MAITGHRSLEEVERYTRAARQGKLADAAIAKLLLPLPTILNARLLFAMEIEADIQHP